MRTGLRVASVVTLIAGLGVGLGFHAAKRQYDAVARPKAASARTSSHVSPDYGRLPLAFEPNVGQAHSDAKFLAHGDGYALLLEPGEAVLALRTPARGNKDLKARANVLRMQLVGANDAASFSAIDELPGKSNYLIGKNPANWHTNVVTYSKVAERGIYPGVDVVYYGTQRQLEYDFVVAPEASFAAIRLAIQGTRNLQINKQGELVMKLTGGEVRLCEPVAYQEAGTEKQMVAANYAMDANHEVRFQVGAYDRTRPLIIDPVLAYSSSLGGTDIDGANAIAVAPDMTAFIAGGTFSTDFPTAHPLQPNHGGPDDFSRDAFVAKISADGSTLLYATYLGGSKEDVANGIAVDPFGDAYVTGTTESPDFPVTPGTLNPDCGGDAKCGASYNSGGLIVSNAFVSKLNPEGSGLIYSTFLGYYENVRGQAIAVDANQNAYITGQTGENITPTVVIIPPAQPPPPFPIVNAFEPAFGGGATDCFITKISATGDSVLYSSYLGGSDEDTCYGVAVDSNQNAYVTGLTYSTDLPLANAIQVANGGAGDAFVSKVNTNGTGAGSLLFSTYLGGSGLDQGNGVAVDNSGHVYVAGFTNSAGLPLGTGSGSYAGQGDAFAAEYATPPSLTPALLYFSYVGGSLADSANGIAVDSLGNAYIAGSTVSTNFPSTGGPFQPAFNGGNADAFVTELNPTGSALVYSTYLGGTNTDIAYGIAVDANSPASAYVAGQTCSPDFPQSNPLPIAPGGNCDAFISKVSILQGIAVNPSGLSFPTQSLNTTSQPLLTTITNGQNPLNITGITVTGPNAGDFVASQNCLGAMIAGAKCSVSVTFTPQAAGIRKASLTITNSGLTNPTVVISLTGSTSSITLSTSNLSFDLPPNSPQPVGVTTAAQAIKVTNSGASPITISSITASGDFAESDNCVVAALQPTTNCVINVTYTPSAAGSSVGAITINDNAAGSPQVVLLNGNAVVEQFTISALSVKPTVSAGQAAAYTLSITPIGGFSQPVALSCGELPFGASCSATQNPVTLSGSGSTQVGLTINTEARTSVPPSSGNKGRPATGVMERLELPLFVLLLALVSLTTLSRFIDRRVIVPIVFVAGLLVFSIGCNGGGPAGAPAGTPAGTYQVTVTGTSGSSVQVTMVTLQVN